MNLRPLYALGLSLGLVALYGCPPGTNVSPLPGASASPAPSPGASSVPSPVAPASPGWGTTPGAASDAYAQAIAELGKQNASTWTLYRIEGNSLASNGLATESGQTWNVFLYAGGKSWQASVVPGIGVNLSEVSQAEKQFKSGQTIDPATLKVDSNAAVTAAGGSTTGTMVLYSAAQFGTQTGKTSTAPVWVVNTSGTQIFVNANSGATIQ